MPTMRRPVEHDLELDRTSAGVGSLSMFGRNMASHGSVPVMDVYEDDVEQGGELSIMRPSRHCIRDINLNTKANHMHRLPAIVQSTRVDLLDSILAGQKILMTPSRHVTITKDGTLQLNAPSVKRSPEKKISNIRLSISGPPPTRAPVPLPVTSPAHQDLFLVKPEPGISLSNTQNDVPQRMETNVYSDVEEPVEADEMSTDDGSLKEVVPPVDGQNDQSPKSDNSNDDNLVIDDTDKKESTCAQ
ncbi:hypothetical protein HDE_00667 [Halotydeus destructor]|nr:hypothetical protein HDE_00667 [Halotydeus destructor]